MFERARIRRIRRRHDPFRFPLSAQRSGDEPRRARDSTAGSIAMLGIRWPQQSGRVLDGIRFLRRERDDLATAFGLASPRSFDDLLEVVVRFFRKGLASSADFVDNRIGRLHGVCSFTSSSGVQMTGGSKPARRQMASIRPRIVAFAMCVQFQVTSSPSHGQPPRRCGARQSLPSPARRHRERAQPRVALRRASNRGGRGRKERQLDGRPR